MHNLLDFFPVVVDTYIIGRQVKRFNSTTSTMNEKPMSRQTLKERTAGGNSLRSYRESLLMSKAELARKAHVSPITISRIEDGYPCRMDTKRKIILALGLKLSEKHKVFSD
jgi:DNA-binding XRE family transcriptional regulator